MAQRIDQTFRRLKRNHRKALIAYVTAGFPRRSSFQSLVRAVEGAGADLLEIGVPFSDPVADGPTIQRSSQVALAQGVTLDWILRTVRALRHKGVRLPLILMSYANPIYTYGVKRFFQKARSVGVDGLIVPDLTLEESAPYRVWARKSGVHLIYLVAPTTPISRVRRIARMTRGFLYAVSLTGVTGARKALPSQVSRFLTAVKQVSPKPVAVGFGVSTPQQVRQMSQYADGVIVGSALIEAIERSKGTGFSVPAHFIRSLANALVPRKDKPLCP